MVTTAYNEHKLFTRSLVAARRERLLLNYERSVAIEQKY